MKYFLGLLTGILIAPGWAMAAQQPETAQISKPQPVDIRTDHGIDARNWRVQDIFMYLLGGTGLHGGFAAIAGCSDSPNSSLQIKQGVTIRQAMSALVAANPGFRWELKDGVVDLIPQDGVPLLRTRIRTFQMNSTDLDALSMIGDALALPEVRQRQAALGLKPGMCCLGLFTGEVHPVPKKSVPVQINVRNVSLLEALNKIVQASPHANWIYHETDCDGAKTYVVDER